MVINDLSPTLYPGALLFPWFAAAALCGALLVVETSALFLAASLRKYRWQRLLLALAALGVAFWAGLLAYQDWFIKPNLGVACSKIMCNYHGQFVSCCEIAPYLEKLQTVEPLTWLTVAATIMLLALGGFIIFHTRRNSTTPALMS